VTRSPGAFGPVGYFLLVLGAGVILDADRVWLGGAVMAGGVLCILAGRRSA
jgi:hypothetical protein